MDDLSGFVAYDGLVRGPLADLGWRLDEVSWRAGNVAWSDFDIVVIRTTWDYQDEPAAFIEVLQTIAAATRLENDIGTVRWNLRKSYLRELARTGVRTVPTLWGESADELTIRAAFDELHTDQLVIKPEVGANAGDTVWLRASDLEIDANLHYAASVFRQRRYLLQPFVPSVVEEGEYSVIFIDGAYSHTVLKTPRPLDFRVQEEHGGTITAVSPEAALLECAHAAVAAVRPVPLYARADLVRLDERGFALMELELIEPSLYLSYDDGAAARLARAIDTRASIVRTAS
jgi:hypothetical protein